MVIGLVTLEVHLPHARSLKDKRQVVERVKDRLRARFNVAVAELDHQDGHGIGADAVERGMRQRHLAGLADHQVVGQRQHGPVRQPAVAAAVARPGHLPPGLSPVPREIADGRQVPVVADQNPPVPELHDLRPGLDRRGCHRLRLADDDVIWVHDFTPYDASA